MPWEPNLPNPTAPPLPCGRQPSLYYYPSTSLRAAPVLCGAGWQPAADCQSARRAKLACAPDDPAPGSPEYPARLGCGSAAMWGRLAACGGLSTRPASGARLRARRSGPRQPGISRAVGLRLCCYVGQAGSLRRVVNPPGERSSPPRETISPRQPGISRAVGLRLCCSVGQAGTRRPIAGALWARPGGRRSPARETISPRQPGISRAVGLRLRCSAGQAASLRSSAGALWARPGERSSPARRSGPRQPGISRAVGLRLRCSAGQAGSLRSSAGALWARPGERSSPARRSGPRQPGISRAVGLRLCCSAGQVVNRPGERVSPVRSASRPELPNIPPLPFVARRQAPGAARPPDPHAR